VQAVDDICSELEVPLEKAIRFEKPEYGLIVRFNDYKKKGLLHFHASPDYS
jgi:hypothetical protein